MAQDLTKMLEGVMNRSLETATKVFNERLDKLSPHGLGEEKVPPEDELREYIATIAATDDPAKAGRMWISQTAEQYGYPKARTMYVEYTKRNEQALAKLVEKNALPEPEPMMPPTLNTPEPEYGALPE
jgi:hypothetical protein